MKKVRFFQINCFYVSDVAEYDDDDNVELQLAWQGNIIVDKNYYFEGIVNNNSKNNFDRLVLGNLIDLNGILLMKYSGHGYCPCTFTGYSDGNLIWGQFEIVDYDEIVDTYNFAISIQPVEATNADFMELSARIIQFKANSFGQYEKFFYKANLDTLSSYVKELLKAIENDKAYIEDEIGFEIKKIKF